MVTWLTPREHRLAFQSIYAFCRWSDDLGDEIGDPMRSFELLEWRRGELRAMYQGQARHPVMVALAETVSSYNIPSDPFQAAHRRLRARSDSHGIPDLLSARGLLHAIGQPGRSSGAPRRPTHLRPTTPA